MVELSINEAGLKESVVYKKKTFVSSFTHKFNHVLV